ncbi:iron-sulfur cluster assembly scaffold protein [Pelagibacterales bacterium SAG-MED43]|nr:iron-sulfur cluster assembly scaffold protein [Pelagibacterales bacterium SAG-MED43]
MDLEIINIASNTDNNRNIKSRTHHSKLKNSLCGDEIKIDLIIKGDKIIDFGYEGKSCIYCQASASLLSEISINNNKFEINELCDDVKSYFEGNLKIVKKKWKSLDKLFKTKNKSRKECILLPFKAIKKIISV